MKESGSMSDNQKTTFEDYLLRIWVILIFCFIVWIFSVPFVRGATDKNWTRSSRSAASGITAASVGPNDALLIVSGGTHEWFYAVTSGSSEIFPLTGGGNTGFRLSSAGASIFHVGPNRTPITEIKVGQYDTLASGSPYATQADLTAQTGASPWVPQSIYNTALEANSFANSVGGSTKFALDSKVNGAGAPNTTSGASLQNVSSNSVIYIDASGDIQEVALGDSGKYLKSQGLGSAPTWDTPAGGGGGSGVTTVRASDGTEAEATALGDAASGIFVIGAQGIESTASGNTVTVKADGVHSMVSTFVAAQLRTYLADVAFSGTTDFALDSAVSDFVNGLLRTYLARSAFTGATDFAVDSAVSEMFRTYLAAAAFSGSGTTNFATKAELTAQTGSSPWETVTAATARSAAGAFTGTTDFATNAELTAQTGGSPWVTQVQHNAALAAGAVAAVSLYALPATKAELTAYTSTSPWATSAELTAQTGSSPWETVTAATARSAAAAFSGDTKFATKAELTAYTSTSPWATSAELTAQTGGSPWVTQVDHNAAGAPGTTTGTSLWANGKLFSMAVNWSNSRSGDSAPVTAPCDFTLTGVSVLGGENMTIGVSVWMGGAIGVNPDITVGDQALISLSGSGTSSYSESGTTSVPAGRVLLFHVQSLTVGPNVTIQVHGNKN